VGIIGDTVRLSDWLQVRREREREEKKYLHYNTYCLALKDRVPRVYAKPYPEPLRYR
jgi:hypothetical protein